MRTTVDDANSGAPKFADGTRVEVWRGLDDGGGDDWAIGERGTVESTRDGQCEVALDDRPGSGTYQFGEYQLADRRREIAEEGG